MTKWGEVVTSDYLYSGSARTIGLSNEKECFVVKDLYTGLVHAYPTDSRSYVKVIESINLFGGRRKIQTMYSDTAPEFIKAARSLGIPLETSTPGIPHTNGSIERSNQLIIGGTVTNLIAAGMPPCYWTCAAQCFCVNFNTENLKGISNWEKH